MTSLTTFHPFPRLPAELRCIIWKHVSHFPQEIEFQIGRKDQTQFIFIHYNNIKNPPAILYASKESREEGLRYHTALLFTSGYYKSSPQPLPSPLTIYINFDATTIVANLWAWDLENCSTPGEGRLFVVPESINLKSMTRHLLIGERINTPREPIDYTWRIVEEEDWAETFSGEKLKSVVVRKRVGTERFDTPENRRWWRFNVNIAADKYKSIRRRVGREARWVIEWCNFHDKPEEETLIIMED